MDEDAEFRIKVAAEVISDITKGPIHDIVRPVTKPLGQFLGAAVSAALNPLTYGLRTFSEAWTYAEHEMPEYLEARQIPPEALRTPAAEVVTPIIQGLQFADTAKDIRNLYLNLLATAMDSREDAPHPAFAAVVKELSADEAQLIPLFVPDGNMSCATYAICRIGIQNAMGDIRSRYNNLTDCARRIGINGLVKQEAIENLARLQIVHITDNVIPTREHDSLNKAVNHLVEAERAMLKPGESVKIIPGAMTPTVFGRMLARACVAGPPVNRD